MILTTILCLTTSIFLTLPKINNPLIITLIIILIALITASIFGITLSSWYAFLLFLIYVGGMLVMFAYFTATSPNQQTIRNKRVIKVLLLAIPITSAFIFFNNQVLITASKSHQLIRIFTSHNIYTLIIITLILLITIVIVVKLCSRSKGPLRTFMT